ncbi:MAG TPA: hypothetical protein VFJ04_06405 [Rhodanobacteraceae bacterium]|nr:hypothetical protein [Rhodanobacteraceae bacterium]
MNEFEWLRQTRALNQPVMPSRDLWPAIAARLGAPATTASAPRGRNLLPWAMAASLAALTLLAGGLSLRQAQAPATGYTALAPATQGARWKPSDPRLSGAAIELDAAHSELTQAMRQAPRAAFLQRLLDRTNQQRDRLERFEHEAG